MSAANPKNEAAALAIFVFVAMLKNDFGISKKRALKAFHLAWKMHHLRGLARQEGPGACSCPAFDPPEDESANAPWLTAAHTICTDQGIPPGHISDRIEALRVKLESGEGGK